MKTYPEQELHSVTSLREDLVYLGIQPGMHLLVHSSFKAIGQVVGGPVAVILALEAAITETGTLVMPTFTERLCDPSEEENYYPEHQRDFVRVHIPLYDPDLTLTDKVNGIIPEVFRKQRGVLRSSHPHLSFAAWGKHAQAIIDHHSFDYALGEGSPLGKLYQLQGYILLLGAPKDTNSSLHLAEYRQPGAALKPKNWDACMLVDGERRWVQYKDIQNSNADFAEILDAFMSTSGFYRKGKVGDAESYLVSQPQIVDFATGWMDDHRP